MSTTDDEHYEGKAREKTEKAQRRTWGKLKTKFGETKGKGEEGIARGTGERANKGGNPGKKRKEKKKKKKRKIRGLNKG